jgi:Zn-dependent protease
VGRAIHIGTISGISIKVHPTFGLVLLWVVYQWGFAADAGWRGIAFGSCVLAAVFGCVLAHEMAHALAARRYRLEVHDITLLPIGGVARVEYAALRPRAEVVIAIAGPLMNVAVALLFTPLVIIVATLHHLSDPIEIALYADRLSLGGFILYVWITNLLLAVFNMIPAFPMDGGRVLRALLSIVSDRLVATRIAAALGQLMAVAFALVGLLFGDYLLPLVSLFILIAAQTEARFVRVEWTLRRLPVGQFALWEHGGIRPDVSLAQAIRGGLKDMVVTQGGQVVGMLWRHDILKHLNGHHHQLRVKDIMDTRVTPVEAADSVYDAHLWLSATNRPAVAVVHDGQYRGIFTHERLAHVYQHIEGRAFRRQHQLLSACLARLRLVSR